MAGSENVRNMTMSNDDTTRRRPPGRFVRERRNSESVQSADPRGSLRQSFDNVGGGGGGGGGGGVGRGGGVSAAALPKTHDDFYKSEIRRRCVWRGWDQEDNP